MARWLATAGLLALLGAAGPAAAAPPETVIRGPYCPPAGCPGSQRSGLGSAAGFAATAGAALLLSRRRSWAGPAIASSSRP